LSFGLTFRLSA